MIAWLAVASAIAAPRFGVDRVDVLSEDPGLWLADEAPRLGTATSSSALRFVEQLKISWQLPVDGWFVGTSLASQSVVVERPVWTLSHADPASGLLVTGGLQTKALLPRGALVGVAWRHGPVRVGLSLNAVSSASWARPDWTVWRVLPGLGVGFGRAWRPAAAPWMESPR